MNDYDWIQAAKNRQPVRLVNGDIATLLSWGITNNRGKARIQFPSGRQRTVKKYEIKHLTEIV
jgi:hypothetical protein